ncbi:MAG: potassium channel protein [Acidobacteria bacterium]|nr:potassium channel protein [Acidobacteriota bacterium]MBV9147390.1 potassium channel protein [Acidobacteriota bacterium]MBV9437066.1 potassium channel protein [Acidobacteriota bacterium]
MARLPGTNPLQTFRKVLWIGCALLILSAIGTIGFHLIEGWSWLDSFYMVVITFSSIGYGEVHPLSRTGRIFNVGLIICGALAVALGIGSLTEALLEFELLQYFGKRKMDRQIARLSGHYIICGAGRVGRSAARELAKKPVPFVVVEREQAKAEALDPEWLVIHGDATQESTLQAARIQEAAGLVAATTTDAGNIFIVLNARSLNPKLKIIARASEEEAAKHLTKAGANSVISPYVFAGHYIAQGLLRPNVVDFLTLTTGRDGRHDMVIEEIAIGASSPLAGTTIGQSGIHRDYGVIVLAIKHPGGETRFNPQARDEIGAGDCLIAMGEPSNMSNLELAAAEQQ